MRQGRGDGIAAAYRAGARMRNAELRSFVNMVHAVSREVIFGAEDHMDNANWLKWIIQEEMAQFTKFLPGLCRNTIDQTSAQRK